MISTIMKREDCSTWKQAGHSVGKHQSLLSLVYSRVIRPGEKAMAPHSSTLAWQISWTEEPGRLQSMGSLRVRHDWVTSLSLSTFMHWRGKWQPTPVFLPGESHGWRSLVGCSPWGHTESDTTEATWQQYGLSWHGMGQKKDLHLEEEDYILNNLILKDFFYAEFLFFF